MSEIKNIPSNEGWKKLVSYIIKTTTISEAIDDINLKTDGTFSSVKIDALLRSLKEETEGYAETLCGNLARLELKIVDNAESCTESNILYLFTTKILYNLYSITIFLMSENKQFNVQ